MSISQARYTSRLAALNQSIAVELHSQCYGMWNPHFCKSDAHPSEDLITNIEQFLASVKPGRRALEEQSDG